MQNFLFLGHRRARGGEFDQTEVALFRKWSWEFPLEGDSLLNAVIRGKYDLHANKFRMVIFNLYVL